MLRSPALSTRMRAVDLIRKKRDCGELSREEIDFLVSGYTRGEIPDYQMAAWLMAVCIRGLNRAEIAALTEAMLYSGEVLSHSEIPGKKVDKHSTGGVGDKTSLILAPIVAAGGLTVPMISGRGLGMTGGTLDKLESIPGFNVNLDDKRALKQLEKIGLFMIGQTDYICPADKKLYALRDVTGTVPSQPLIVASIMSKKLAENLDRLVLDVKFGSGAFMKTKEEAEQLAKAMTSVGESMKVKTSSLLSPMDEPLGRNVGNALEVAECIEILQGGGPPDLIKLIVDLAEKVSTTSRSKLETRLKDGSAWKKFVSLVYAQDGDATVLEKILEQHRAPIVQPWPAKSAGIVKKIDAELIGRASVMLGAGRQKADAAIDFAVGFSKIKKVGERVALDEPLFTIHARNERSIVNITPLLQKAVEIG